MDYFFPSLLLFSFSLLSQIENGCKCIVFVSGVICNHTTPTTPTTHPDQTRPQETHPDQTPTIETITDAILKGHHRPRPEAAEPPTHTRPARNTQPDHPHKKAVRTTANTTRSDRRRHTKGRTETPRQDTRQFSPQSYTTDKTTARPDIHTRGNGNKPQSNHHRRQSGRTTPTASPPQGQTAHRNHTHTRRDEGTPNQEPRPSGRQFSPSAPIQEARNEEHTNQTKRSQRADRTESPDHAHKADTTRKEARKAERRTDSHTRNNLNP